MNGIIEFSKSTSEETSRSLNNGNLSRLFTVTISAKVNGIVVGSVSACKGNMFNDIDDGWAIYDLQTDNKEYHYSEKTRALGGKGSGIERNEKYPGLGTLLLDKIIDYLSKETNKVSIQSLLTAIGFYEKVLGRFVSKNKILGYIRGSENFDVFIR